MHLERIEVKNFRSIKHLTIDECKDLNVLIGKNNAGKSNILGAINTFFTAIKGGRIVGPSPISGEVINFYNKQTTDPIEITLEFSLSSEDRQKLSEEISSEAPHVKNALEGLDEELRLAITVSIGKSQDNFSLVNFISLRSPNALFDFPRDERILLQIGESAASDLFGKASRTKRIQKDITGLRELIKNSAIRNRGMAGDQLLRHYIRISGAELSQEVLSSLEQAARTLPEDADLVPTLKQLIGSLEQEASSIQRQKLNNAVRTFSGDETSIPKYIFSLIERLTQTGIIYFKELRKPIGKQEAQKLLDLKMSRGGPQVLKRIQEIVASLLGVQIDAFRGDSQAQSLASEAELDVDNFLVQANGSGIRESLRLILDYEFEKPALLLIEEPEVHLHPALEASIMGYLKTISSSCQVFLTTHSTTFLDNADLTNVYLVSRRSATEIQRIDFGEAEALLPKELGLRMSSLFMYDRLVFVEGASDEAILREWASILDINLSQVNVGFIRMGGSRNFTYFASSETLNFLSRRKVNCWILLDKDEKDEIQGSSGILVGN